MSALRIEPPAEATNALRIGGELGIQEGTRDAERAEGPSFANILEKMVEGASNQENTAVAKAEALAAGSEKSESVKVNKPKPKDD